MLKEKKVTVTGASGFVGRALVKAMLDKEWRVTAVQRSSTLILTHPNLTTFHDYSDKTLMQATSNADVVVHLASPNHITGSSQENENRFESDILGLTESVAEEVLRSGGKCRFIFLSTLNVHIADRENATFYSKYKKITEERLEDRFSKLSARLAILRPPLVYDLEAVGNFAALQRLVKSGLPIPLAYRTAKRSYLSRQNLIDAICLMIEKPEWNGGVYELADPQSYTLLEVLRGIAKKVGKPLRIIYLPRFVLKTLLKLLGKKHLWETINQTQTSDTSRFVEEFEWRPNEGWLGKP